MEENLSELLKKYECDWIFKDEESFREYCMRESHAYPISVVRLKKCIFLYPLFLRDSISIKLQNCYFMSGLILKGHVERQFEMTECHIYKKFHLNSYKFKPNARFRGCHFYEKTNFRNTKFMNLADFWKCHFHNSVVFYKTDFNATAVFSSATFYKNILFTYSLFAGRVIFGRTKFNSGFDFSQAIISGDLKLFDIKYKYHEYYSKYVGDDDEDYRICIEEKCIIPLVNKVATFQILKNQYSKEGNHIDEIEMRKYEKTSFAELIDCRRSDKNWLSNSIGDFMILRLNRWTNHYKSDFRNGISFTFVLSILFVLLILLFSESFYDNICWGCEVDWLAFNKGMKLYIDFLNPVHKITYIDDLKPLWGIPYILDFFGRIVIGFCIYQTIQAFRKYK